MSEGKRPGGLTALAVINFIFGAFSALDVLGLLARPFLIERTREVAERSSDEAAKARIAAMTEMGQEFFIGLAIFSGITAILMVISGIGYLQQKKFLGRTLGNVYGGLGVVAAFATAMSMPVALGGGFNIGTIVSLIYPVLTLILLNGTFKEDFIR
jgi:hypothetical protein